MDPRMIPKGSSPEQQSEGRRPNQPGVYYHPQAEKFIETSGVRRPDGSMSYASNDGKIQGDAFVQIGFRPANENELKEYEERKKESAARSADKRRASARSV